MNPHAVAFYGANENVPYNMGALQLLTLIDNGFQGKIYPIHPNLETIFGLKAYKSIKEIPGKVDLAEIVVSKKHVPQILTELGEIGVNNVILVTAGFREINNNTGSNELKEIALKFGLHILGPNCIGILNTHTNYSNNPNEACILNTTVQSYSLPPGNVSIASQSGTFVSHTFAILKERNLYLNKTFSLGNEAIIDLCDCLEYLETDPFTEVIMIYIEEIKRGRLFFDIAKRISRKKPIIALYVGGTEGGAKAVSSHTGSMAGKDEIYDGLFKQTGIIRTYSVEEFFDTAMIFSHLIPLGVIPKGKKIVVMTNSGGPGATMADRISRKGLELPLFSEEVKKKIQKYLVPTAQPSNPLDFTFSLNPVDFFIKIPRIIARSGEFDGMVIYGAYGDQFFNYTSFGKEFIEKPKPQEILLQWREMAEASVVDAQKIVKKYKFPMVFANLWGYNDSMFRHLNENLFPTYQTPHRCVDALFNLIKYGEYLQKFQIYSDKD
nr:succinyl-CoA synthetase subunit alpha [Candidatus Prometheoarchaeum syntrophicum]